MLLDIKDERTEVATTIHFKVTGLPPLPKWPQEFLPELTASLEPRFGIEFYIDNSDLAISIEAELAVERPQDLLQDIKTIADKHFPKSPE